MSIFHTPSLQASYQISLIRSNAFFASVIYSPSTPTRVHPSLAVVLSVGNVVFACTDTLKSRQKKNAVSTFFILSLLSFSNYFYYIIILLFLLLFYGIHNKQNKKQPVKTFSILNVARLISFFFTFILPPFLKYLLEKYRQVAYTKTVCVNSTSIMNST